MTLVTIRGLLALPVILPIGLGLYKFKTADNPARLFLLFLIIGFLTDLSVWIMLQVNENWPGHEVFDLYALIEALFYFWFASVVTNQPVLKIISKILLILTPFWWVFCMFLYPRLTESTASGLFIPSYEIAGAFVTGFALLALSESEENLFASASFWFLAGIFFYTFCTFFIMTLMDTRLLNPLWFLNNVFNILSYLFFTLGFRAIKPLSPSAKY
ncbi:MAG: hypothetical protein JSS79_01175 [Bacteroidetes bacterium]|nr:hypothetical protein [Bacteroidota bacterium]